MERFDEASDPRWERTAGENAASGQAAEEERKLAVERACELLGIRTGRAGEETRPAGPITEEDRNLIVWNIDELFLV